MYKLKNGVELPKEFKIKVNPEQSEALQKHLFNCGYSWFSLTKLIMYVESRYLYLEENKLTHFNTKSYFKENKLQLIKFKDYFEKVDEIENIRETAKQAHECMQNDILETSFPEKWCIEITEDNYKELNVWMHRNWKNYKDYTDKCAVSVNEKGFYFLSTSMFNGIVFYPFKHDDIKKDYTKITTEQFRKQFGILTENGVLPLEIKRLQEENEELKKQIEVLTDQKSLYFAELIYLNTKIDGIREYIKEHL